MVENPGIAFFHSSDAAGFVTLDKPPVGLRVQAVSAVIFGYSCRVLVLPLALAGVGSGSGGGRVEGTPGSYHG
jgi:4-amino-4-deoxy-L-arabinose transferase-like glycosyltransferase